jgi:hypothetical protein
MTVIVTTSQMDKMDLARVAIDILAYGIPMNLVECVELEDNTWPYTAKHRENTCHVAHARGYHVR